MSLLGEDQMEDVTNKFNQFKTRLNEFAGIDENTPKDQQLDYIEVIFDIVEGTDNFDFDFEELRLRPILSLAAVLLAKWKNQNVVYICPTTYYGAQATRFIRGFSKEQNPKNITVCPSGWVSDEIARNADVFLHHGKDFREHLPKFAEGKRHVFQIFEGENVPNDSRSLSALVCATYTDD